MSRYSREQMQAWMMGGGNLNHLDSVKFIAEAERLLKLKITDDERATRMKAWLEKLRSK
jgi:hypothetical protein